MLYVVAVSDGNIKKFHRKTIFCDAAIIVVSVHVEDWLLSEAFST